MTKLTPAEIARLRRVLESSLCVPPPFRQGEQPGVEDRDLFCSEAWAIFAALDALDDAGRALEEAVSLLGGFPGENHAAVVESDRANAAQRRAEKAELALAAARKELGDAIERDSEECHVLREERDLALATVTRMREAAEHVIICWQLEQDAATFKTAMESFVAGLVAAIQPSALCPSPRTAAEEASR